MKYKNGKLNPLTKIRKNLIINSQKFLQAKEKGKMTEKARNEKYLAKIYELLKKPERMELSAYKPRFNNSEMRLLGEIIKERNVGKKIISTTLAKRLGVTRSAVSQMVNKLESRGILTRTPDETDKKIAYVELSACAEQAYVKEHENSCAFMDKIIEKMGLEKLDTLIALNEELLTLVEDLKK